LVRLETGTARPASATCCSLWRPSSGGAA